MLLRGGDTDTNAAVVGGLIGAAVGRKGIKSDWISKIMEFDNQSGLRRRDAFLLPKHHLKTGIT